MDKMAIAKPGRKPKGEGHARRGEILAAAEQIFVADGYEGATIRKIATAVGVSSTALYLHFKDKAEILSEICREAFAALSARQEVLAAAETDPVVRLRNMLRCYIEFGFENVNAYRLAFMTYTAISVEDSESLTRKVAAELYAGFEAGVSQAVGKGRTPEELTVLAQILWASVHGLVSIMVMKPHFEWADRSALIEAQLDLLMRGLSSQ